MKVSDKKQIINFIILFGALAAVTATCWFRFDYLMDSDMASELVLSELLSKENAVISPNWYYSTEIKFFSVQLIYTPLFKIFHDWTVIRTGAVIIMYMMILATVYYFLKQYQCECFWGIAGALFLLPISDVYFKMVLCGAYYIPYVVINILTIALIEHYIQSGKKRLIVILYILALLSGLGGIRPIAILYAPLGVESLIMLIRRLKEQKDLLHGGRLFKDREARAYIHAGISCGIALLGFAINESLLARYLSWGEWKQVSNLTGFSLIRLRDICKAIFDCFGGDMSGIPIWGYVCVMTAVLWTGYTIYMLIQNCRTKQKSLNRLAIFTVLSYLIFILLFLFTDMRLESRYFLSVIIFSFLMLAIDLKEKKNKRKEVFCMILVTLTIISSVGVYRNIWRDNSGQDHITIAEFLCENDAVQGYATFWNANVLTDLSNGEIEVWSWANSYDGGKTLMNSVDDINHWLQLKAHTTEKPKGKVFVLLSEGEYQNIKWKDQLDEVPADLNIQGAYRVWIFENYDELKKVLKD